MSNFYSCEENTDEVIDPSINAPLISNIYKSTDTIFTTSANPMINLNTSVSVSENDGGPILEVTCALKFPNGEIVSQYSMLDNGMYPDSVAGDGRYSANVLISNLQCLLVGNYSIEYVANNLYLFSNVINTGLEVVNSNPQPPIIAGTNLPDSVVRPLPGDSLLLTISVNVNDPDGMCDIKNVTFVTVRPNGVTLPAIPMFDNGGGQFLFSNYVSYSTDPTSYGYYKYTFTAKDNSNLLSQPVTDSIKFIQPVQ